MRTLLLLSTFGAALLASPVYTVRVIPLPAGYVIGQPYAINSAGVVAGSAAQAGETHAFVGSPGGSQVLSLPSLSVATGINDSGVVSGSINAPGLSMGFTATTAASVINNPLAGFPFSGTSAINNAGVSVGGSSRLNESPFSQATIWDASGNPTLVNMPVGVTASAAADINASGEIVGSAYDGSQTHGFVGTASGVTLITLPGFAGTFAAQINNHGDIAGQAGGAGVTDAWFRPSGGPVVMIPRLQPDAQMNLGASTALNNRGQLVGTAVLGAGQASAWLWDTNGGLVKLDDLVPTGWQIQQASGINDAGQISAFAFDSNGAFQMVRLDPVPEPGTWLLAAAGLAVIARRRR